MCQSEVTALDDSTKPAECIQQGLSVLQCAGGVSKATPRQPEYRKVKALEGACNCTGDSSKDVFRLASKNSPK